MKTTLKKTKYSVHYVVRDGDKLVKKHVDYIQMRTAVQGFNKIKLKTGKNLVEIAVFDNEISCNVENYTWKSES